MEKSIRSSLFEGDRKVLKALANDMKSFAGKFSVGTGADGARDYDPLLSAAVLCCGLELDRLSASISAYHRHFEYSSHAVRPAVRNTGVVDDANKNLALTDLTEVDFAALRFFQQLSMPGAQRRSIPWKPMFGREHVSAQSPGRLEQIDAFEALMAQVRELPTFKRLFRLLAVEGELRQRSSRER